MKFKKFKEINIYKNKLKFLIIKKKKFLVMIINIIFLTNNILLFLYKTKHNYKKFNFNNLRNSDQFIFILLSNSYYKISDYLNDKYNIYSIFKEKTNKKIIRLYAVNLCSEEEFKRTLLWLLKDKFIIQFDKESPDYLVYNVFDNKENNVLYNNCIKIALYTENAIPDLTNCDYAFLHGHISYEDRYFTLPFCFLRRMNETKHLNIKKIRKKAIHYPRKKFCAAVFSNDYPGSSDLFRLKFVDELSKYKQVDMGGKIKNNVGGPVKNKIDFFLDYKFSISMENTNGDGYISEKIVDSFISGTIPIYYGSYMIEEYINPKAYILINGPQDMIEKIEYIKKIDNDNDLYKSILKENVFIDNKILQKSYKEQSEFWFHIFEQDKNKAKRIFY